MILENTIVLLLAWIFYVFTLESSATNQELSADILQLNKRFKSILTKLLNKEADGDSQLEQFCRTAFKTALKYKNDTIEDDIQNRIIRRYLNIGFENLDDNQFVELYQVRNTGRTIFRKIRKNFHKNAIAFCIASAEKDMEMQKDWKTQCEELSPNATKQIDEYIDMKHEIASEANKKYNRGFNDTVSFWKASMVYDNLFSEKHIKEIWEKELEKPYLEFMLFMRRDLDELFNIYIGIQYNDEPMPAYIYDMIYNSYTCLGMDDTETGPSNLANEYRKFKFYKFLDTLEYFRNRTIKMLVIEIQEYLESLGFDELNNYFWEKSVFETLPDMYTNKTTMVRLHLDDYNKFWIKVVAPVNVAIYISIVEEMLEIHTHRLIHQNNYPPIFAISEYHKYQESVTKAILYTFESESYWTGKREITTNGIEYMKVLALGLFPKLATSVVLNTWELDILANNISPENRYCELWNRKLKYENVVPLTINNEYFDAHKNIDFFMKNSLLFGRSRHDMSFVSSILKYQILAHLCEQAGQYNFDNPLQYPLYHCNLKGNKKVGALLKEVLGYGTMKTWHEILDMITGTKNTRLSAKGLLGYFAPLYEEIRKTKHYQRPISRAKMLKRWGDFCKKK